MLTRKTQALLAATAAFGGLLLLPDCQPDPAADLPTLQALAREDITRIEITQGQVNKVVIEGDWDQGYQVLQPYQAPADRMSLRPLMAAFDEPIHMDLRVDEGHLEDYALDDGKGILVELFAGAEIPAISLVVGADVPGGSSFVRLKDGDEVYRAKVGGRARYEVEATHWKNRLVTDWENVQILGLALETPDYGVIAFERQPTGEVDSLGQPNLGAWSVLGRPDLVPDQRAVDATASSLAVLRAGRTLSSDFDAGWDPPASRVTLMDIDGRSLQLEFGQLAVDGAAYVRRAGVDDVFLVASAERDLTLKGPMDFRNLGLFSFQRDQVTRLRLDDGQLPVIIEPDALDLWVTVEPANVDTDVKQVIFVVNTLAQLRAHSIADGVSATEAGLDEPSAVITVELGGAGTRVLEIGDAFMTDKGQRRFYIRARGDDQVYTYDQYGVAKLLGGFGRGAL
jgi:hypothetical protein